MSYNKFTITGLAMLAMGLGSAAHAGFVTTSSTSPGPNEKWVVNNNEFKDELHNLGIDKYTSGVTLGVDQIGSVTYYYYGKEAGYQNVFMSGPLQYTTGFTPTTQNYFDNPLTIGTVDVNAGSPLDFIFCSLSSNITLVGCVSNIGNDALGWNASQSIAYSLSGNSAWLFWDDSGAGPDDNHDDMLIKAVFTPKSVPEPATLGLFGLGLLGVWAASRRRVARQS